MTSFSLFSLFCEMVSTHGASASPMAKSKKDIIGPSSLASQTTSSPKSFVLKSKLSGKVVTTKKRLLTGQAEYNSFKEDEIA